MCHFYTYAKLAIQPPVLSYVDNLQLEILTEFVCGIVFFLYGRSADEGCWMLEV